MKNSKIKVFITILSLVMVGNLSIQAQSLIYRVGTAASTNNPTVFPNFVESYITSQTPLSAGAGITANAGSSYNWTGFGTADKAAALVANDYWIWSFSTSQNLTLENFGIRLDRSNTGPSNVFIGYSIGAVGSVSSDYSTYTSLLEITSLSASGADFVQSFSSLALNSGQEIKFVLTAWGGTGTFDLENSDFSSANQTGIYVTAVPEPASSILMALGVVGLIGIRAMRRKSS